MGTGSDSICLSAESYHGITLVCNNEGEKGSKPEYGSEPTTCTLPGKDYSKLEETTEEEETKKE